MNQLTKIFNEAVKEDLKKYDEELSNCSKCLEKIGDIYIRPSTNKNWVVIEGLIEMIDELSILDQDQEEYKKRILELLKEEEIELE